MDAEERGGYTFPNKLPTLNAEDAVDAKERGGYTFPNNLPTLNAEDAVDAEERRGNTFSNKLPTLKLSTRWTQWTRRRAEDYFNVTN